MILDRIAQKTTERVEQQKKKMNLKQVISKAAEMPCNTDFPFERALQTDEISFICEIKKASPSKGVISKDFDYLNIAKQYEASGAAAISVLTEPLFFMGDNRYLKEISDVVRIPLLRKDFIIDAYQIYEAKLIGASAILLICGLLKGAQLAEYIHIAHSLGLSALIESHTKEEVHLALAAGGRVIGINNRDLKTFKVDLSNTIRLRELVPQDRLFISESGIQTHEDIALLKKNNVHGVLIGESFMTSGNIQKQFALLRGEFNG
jgi:indole-3-glycerol phosphate synthase